MEIIEKRVVNGAAGLTYCQMVINHPKYGRMLMVEGLGRNNGSEYQYHWRHGVAARLKGDDTFETLDTSIGGVLKIINAVVSDQDPDRPCLNWPGDMIADVAESALECAE